MKLGMLLNRLICDAHAKFRVSSFKNVVTITADTHTHTHTYIQVDRIPDFFFSQVKIAKRISQYFTDYKLTIFLQRIKSVTICLSLLYLK